VLFDSWGGNIVFGAIGAVAGAIIPLISIWILENLKLANYSEFKNVNFRHILFLIFFTAILHSLSRFFIYAKSAVFTINPVDFLSHYIVGDIIGGIVVIWTILKVLPYVVSAAKA
jgi:ABC-type multidrug transport system fused ATPase/permease subunit